MKKIYENFAKKGVCAMLTREQVIRRLQSQLSRGSRIASAVGCRDYSHFCKVFKRVTGILPSSYGKVTKGQAEETSAPLLHAG